MVKLFATDLDGTLLNGDHESDAIIEQGINAVFESGHYFTVATGRHYHQVPVRYSNTHGYYVCLNGALIVDSLGNVIHESLIDKTVLSEFIDKFHDMNFEYISKDHIYTFMDEATHQTSLKKAFLEMGEEVSWIDKFMYDNFKNTVFCATKQQILEAPICKINVHRHKDQDYSIAETYLVSSTAIMNTPSDPEMMEITACGVSKASALKWLASMLGISEEAVYVYGDGGNDIEMLRAFSHSFAPCNASEVAKDVASTIIGPFEDHSVIAHIQDMIKQK